MGGSKMKDRLLELKMRVNLFIR